jgi:translation initiation factor 3 subunit D
MAQTFQLSALIASLPDSEGGAWGPPSSTDSSLNDVPYAPYSKGDKLGRMADWTQDSGKDGRDARGGRQGYNSRTYRGMSSNGGGGLFFFFFFLMDDGGNYKAYMCGWGA